MVLELPRRRALRGLCQNIPWCANECSFALHDLPPKPAVQQGNVSFWQYLALFWRDILSAQPPRLYGAWMAEFRTPFFRSYLLNQPDLIKRVLKTQPMDFPKFDRIGAGLQPLLGKSVFLTNGAEWQRQRCIIDPAF